MGNSAIVFGVFGAFMWGAAFGGMTHPSTETLVYNLCVGTIAMVACVALLILADRRGSGLGH